MGRVGLAVEVALIVVLAFIYAGGATPGVNESHYWARSKHFWDTTWCARDLFLDSRDAHPVYQFTFGWLANQLSLPAAAWIGRLLGWLLLAVGWTHLSQSYLRARGAAAASSESSTATTGVGFGWSLFSAAIAMMLWDRAHMSGEWVVGSLEAKVPAYALLFWGMGAWLRGSGGNVSNQSFRCESRSRSCFVWFGLATAFHPLVGGWALLGLFAVCVYEIRYDGQREDGRANRGQWVRLALNFTIGLTIGLAGVIPALALNWGVEEPAIQAAHDAYVFRRLGHHLLLIRFPTWFVLRHAALIALWFFVWRWLQSQGDVNDARRRLHRLVSAMVVLLMIGAFTQFVAIYHRELCAAFSRYYWFRMSDALVPVGASLLLTAWLANHRLRLPVATGWTLIACMGILVGSFGQTYLARRSDPRPTAVRQEQSRDLRGDVARAESRHDWLQLCDWIKQNTPPDDLFLSPTKMQTFKWLAERAEVASWKDIPQNAASIAEWVVRLNAIRDSGLYAEEVVASRDDVTALQERWPFEWVIVEKRLNPIDWDRAPAYENGSFALYRWAR